jgi:methylmalonyl-CoA mutase
MVRCANQGNRCPVVFLQCGMALTDSSGMLRCEISRPGKVVAPRSCRKGMPMSQTANDLPLAADFEPATEAQWLSLVEKVLRGADFERRLVSSTADGLRVRPLYTRAATLAEPQAAIPGAAPFTRGTKAKPQGLGWEIRQLYAEHDPERAKAAILDDLDQGVGGVTLQIEAPGQFGLPGRRQAIAEALDGVLLDLVPVSLMAGDDAIDAAGALVGLWRERKIPEAQWQGALNADPLGTLARTGVLTHPIERAVQLAARFGADPLWGSPQLTALLADGRPYHESGSSEAQELAGLLATLVAYLRACEAEGLTPGRALPRVALALAADTDLFLTIAKLRAARKLVWRVADAAGAGDAARHMHLTASTSQRMMARRDPWVNLLRATTACAGAAFGGAEAVTVLPFTWALGQPDAFARRLARNTQIVLQEEVALGRVVDPAGGSWYVERLTEDLARKAWELFQEIEAQGGMAAALRSGFVQDRIGAVAGARERDIASGRLELTGVSAFPLLTDDGIKVVPHPAAPPVAAATMQIKPLTARRLAAPFEALRDAADAQQARTGRRPRVFLASLGALAEHNTRSTWMKNFLAAGGIEALASDGCATAAQAAAAIKTSGATVACLCSSDAVYAKLAAETSKALKAAGASHVYLAGRPGDEAALRAAGVDGFVFAGQDAVAVLSMLQEQLK